MPRRLRPLLLLALLACAPEPPAPGPGIWIRRDLWLEAPKVELHPFGDRAIRPLARRISFLGAAEVRDMSRVPPQQLVAFPRRTAGQVRALAQMAGSRVHWRLRVPPEGYLSFVPLGTETPCACTYRVGLRGADGVMRELYRLPAEPVAPIAQATVEVDLAEQAGKEVDLLFQVDGPPDHPRGQPIPVALWGSPAVYGRGAPPAPRPAGKRPSVLLLGLDTLRADALGPWGRTPSLTPEIDRLAGESDVWLDAFSTFNVTNPSFASILTGLYGKDHGVYDLGTPLPSAHTTLAELFAGAGYDTLAVISARHLGDHNSGLGQGFQEVTTADEHFAAELAADMAMDWIGERGGRPFFAWVHLFDPHTPHTPPQPFALGLRPSEPRGLDMVPAWIAFRSPGPRPFAEPVLGGHKDLYDGEVAYLDRQVGRLLDFLRSRDLLESTVVALVADHGESLGEHGIVFRHVGLHDTTTHVPLLIRWPGAGGEGRRLRGLVQTIDLFPTLLGAAGLPVPPQDGEDLRRLTAEGRPGRRAVVAEHAGKLGLMVRTRDHKYILSQGNTRFFPDGPSLYDLRADPGETTNLAGRGLPAEAEMSRLLREWFAHRRPAPRAQPRDLSEEDLRRLQALGYQ